MGAPDECGEWQRHFLGVYDRLDVRLTEADFVGESFYNPMLAAVVDELAALGLLQSRRVPYAPSRTASPDGTGSRCR